MSYDQLTEPPPDGIQSRSPGSKCVHAFEPDARTVHTVGLLTLSQFSVSNVGEARTDSAYGT